jgi:hypothetical protein
VNEAVTALEALNSGQDVWMTLNPRKAGAVAGGRYGGVGEVASVNGFAGDVDFGTDGHQAEDHPPTAEDALAVINAVGIETTMTVHTGGGFLPLVLLDHPFAINCEEDRERLNRLCRRFSNAYKDQGRDMGWRVDGGKSIAQLIRVPGTINRKVEGQDRPVTVHSNSGRRYTVEELEALLPAEEAVEATPREAFTGTIPQGTDARDLLGLPCIKNAVDNSWNLPRDEWLMAGRALCHCDNGPEVFRDISRDYERYNAEVVNAQIRDIRENMKPPLCSSIYREFRGEFCEDCPHFERFTLVTGQAGTDFRLNSPITLAIQKAHERAEATKKATQEITIIFGDELDAMDLGEARPIIKDIADEGEGMVIAGRGGIGKSQMIEQIALALASGTPLLGLYETFQPRNVLVFQSENTLRSMQKRQRRLTGADCRLVEAESRIGYVSRGRSGRVAGSIIDRNGAKTEFVDVIHKTIDAYEAKRGKVDVIVFDPLISFHVADENSNSLMRTCCDAITVICDERGMTPILAHHHKKESGKTSDADDYTYVGDLLRGGSAIRDWAAVVGSLVGSKQGTRLTWSKVRDNATPAAIDLRMTDHGFEVANSDFSHFLVPEVINRNGGEVRGAAEMERLIMSATDLSRGNPVTRSVARAALNLSIQAGLVAVNAGRGSRGTVYTVSRQAREIEQLL